MRKISATLILPVDREPIKNGVIITDEQGNILDISPNRNAYSDKEIEFYDGVIIPGLVNAHAHLEYSYVKGLIPPKKGMLSFIKHIIRIKQNQPVDYQKILQADEQMYKNGIVAVGDHTNTLITKDIKSSSPIYYHSFIELYEAISEIYCAKADFYHGLAYLDALNQQGSITPHAPYTINPQLLKLIANYAFQKKQIVSIHNQEAEQEREMFLYGTGEFANFFMQQGSKHTWLPTGTSSIEWFLPFFRENHNILLVHNIYTTEQDIQFALNTHPRLFWVMCPGSNLYIQNRLPNLPIFVKNNCTIALGTDSLASNHTLSIIEEMRILQQAFDIDFHTLLRWATINGAKALELDHLMGSITPGKAPGLVLLQNIDPEKLRITKNINILRLI